MHIHDCEHRFNNVTYVMDKYEFAQTNIVYAKVGHLLRPDEDNLNIPIVFKETTFIIGMQKQKYIAMCDFLKKKWAWLVG